MLINIGEQRILCRTFCLTGRCFYLFIIFADVKAEIFQVLRQENFFNRGERFFYAFCCFLAITLHQKNANVFLFIRGPTLARLSVQKYALRGVWIPKGSKNQSGSKQKRCCRSYCLRYSGFFLFYQQHFAGLMFFYICMNRPMKQPSILLMISIENRYGYITRYKLFEYCHCFLNVVRWLQRIYFLKWGDCYAT